ncbi:hypothetical protein Q8A73_022711 [Channa argus]|nr:hypothetical protein Q8A73_022711 [Channa argus]
MSTARRGSLPVSELSGGNNPGKAAAAARASSPPLPFPSLADSSSSSVSALGLHGRKNTTWQRSPLGSAHGRRPGKQAASTLEPTRRCVKPVDYLQNRAQRKMSPVTSLGSVLDSHNPQRASARGAMQRRRAESRPAECAAPMIFNPLHLCPTNTWF